MGTGDFTLEDGRAADPAGQRNHLLSFPSYVRTVHRMCRLEHGTERSSLLLGKCPSKAAITHCTVISLIWPPRNVVRMWLNRRGFRMRPASGCSSLELIRL